MRLFDNLRGDQNRTIGNVNYYRIITYNIDLYLLQLVGYI